MGASVRETASRLLLALILAATATLSKAENGVTASEVLVGMSNARQARAAGFRPRFLNVSFVGTSDFIKEAGADAEGGDRGEAASDAPPRDSHPFTARMSFAPVLLQATAA
jgi:ABC-type branched-subunit amino acid transport system substrate-binding protein